MKTVLRTLTLAAAVFIAASVHLAASATEKVVYFHNDLAGTPIAATDSFGDLLWQQSYKPYGERLDPKAPAKDTPWFSDKAYVEGAGLSYFGARWYDPQLGRFMGIDPKGFDEANVLSFNRYAYANDNPYRYVDPDGRGPTLALAIGAGVLVVGGGSYALSGPEQRERMQKSIVQMGENLSSNLRWIGQQADRIYGSIFSESNESSGGEAGSSGSVPSKVGPGPNAGDSVPAGPSPRPTKDQQAAIDEIGNREGCHTCGTKEPGTKSGRWIGDHQDPTKLNPEGKSQRYFPQCKDCSNEQGGHVRWLPGPQ